MKYAARPSMAACLALLLAACSTLQVSTDYDPDYDFSSLRTYGWFKMERPPGTDVRISNTLIEDRVRKAIEHELDAKGYRKVTDEAPDYYVAWLGGIDTKLRVDTVESYYDPFWGGVPQGGYWPGYQRTFAREYKEGTLIIDFLNPATHNLIWRGTGSDYLEPNTSLEQMTATINNAVHKILAGFPPGKAPAKNGAARDAGAGG
jgi:hypothetical protein